MIKSVTVTNFVGESLELVLTNPENTGLAVTSITGLGPAQASINTTNLANFDGDIYNSARIGTRNIVISLKFMGSPTIEDSRLLTYKYFPAKKPVSLVFETDNRTCLIEGYVESNEPDIFSEESGCQISIICPNPFFMSLFWTYTRFAGIDSRFEFPFENVGFEPSIEMGEIITRPYNTIYYDGDVNTGITISIHATGTVENIVIYNVGTREIMHIYTDTIEELTGSGIIAGDTLEITTVKGYKSATLLRDGVTYNIINSIGREDDWFELKQGDNTFAYVVDYGDLNIVFDITSNVLYEGL